MTNPSESRREYVVIPTEDLQPLDRFVARLEPRRTDDLRTADFRDLSAALGQELVWDCSWLIEEEDGGPYVGEWACHPADRSLDLPWAPSGDLVMVRMLYRFGDGVEAFRASRASSA